MSESAKLWNESNHGAAVAADLVSRALREDIGAGDVTSLALVPENHESAARIVARHDCVVSGLPVAELVFARLDSAIVFEHVVADSLEARAGAVIAEIRGKTRAILAGERTALNFLQRMTGIATLTNEFVRRVAQFGVKILDTRKTTPTLRALEKYAVLCGGGVNHRMGLYDMVLIKDNHRRIWSDRNCGGLGAAVAAARAAYPGVLVEIEVENIGDMVAVMNENPDWIMLDNMSAGDMRECVKVCGGRCKIEASGGITSDTIEDVARSGVDAVSLGCLTHSAKAADLSLEI